MKTHSKAPLKKPVFKKGDSTGQLQTPAKDQKGMGKLYTGAFELKAQNFLARTWDFM